MNEKMRYSWWSGSYERCAKPKEKTLEELRNEIFEITKKQNYITNCGLSPEVTALALKELQEQKEELKVLLHKKVDEL